MTSGTISYHVMPKIGQKYGDDVVIDVRHRRRPRDGWCILVFRDEGEYRYQTWIVSQEMGIRREARSYMTLQSAIDDWKIR